MTVKFVLDEVGAAARLECFPRVSRPLVRVRGLELARGTRLLVRSADSSTIVTSCRRPPVSSR
jgi:hypothetical protein